MKLWQCECGKTCGSWEVSPIEGRCSTCFAKSEVKRLKAVNVQNLNKQRSANKTEKPERLSRLASYLED